MIRAERICAVIVTYHPSPAQVDHIPLALAQVEGMVIVDNGSKTEALEQLRLGSDRHGFHLIENGDNLGIAEALNRGVRWAKENGFDFVILFDQDSQITDGFIDRMYETWHAHPQRDRVGSLHPKYVHPTTGVEPAVYRAPDGGPLTSMTSGAMMPAWIFDRIGYFCSEYFIDLVDCEYSLRIRAKGYMLADSREAALLHTAGDPKRIKILGFSFGPSHHSAMRRYYISRNRVVVYGKYFRVFPRWTMHSMYEALRETAKCFLAERQRGRKFRNFALGTWDGLTGKMGRRDDL